MDQTIAHPPLEATSNFGDKSRLEALRRMAVRLRKLSTPRAYGLYALVLMFVFLILSFSRLSTASLPFSSDGTDDAPIVLNAVRMTRSDDFLRGIPRWLSFQREGSPDSILDYSNSPEFKRATASPITSTIERFTILPDDLVQRVVGHYSSTEVRFSLREWAVYLRILLVFPLFFKLSGFKFRSGVIAGLGVSLTPLSLWFGGSAAAMTAAVLLPISLTLLFVNIFRSTIRLRRLIMVVLAIYIGTTSFGAVEYPPWKWPAFAVFGAFALGALLGVHGLRRTLTPLLIVGAIVGVYQLLRWSTFREQYSTVLDTVYPGNRRSSGGGGYGNPMSGAITGLMQTDKSKTAGTINPELAFGLNALVWPVLICTPFLITRLKTDTRARSLLFALVPMGLIILWVSAPWPTALLNFNPLTFVPSERAGQILGIVSLVLFLALSETRPIEFPRSYRLVACVSAFVVFQQSIGPSVDWIQKYYVQYSSTIAWILVLLFSLCVLVFFFIKRPTLAVIPIVLFTLFSSVKIQPLTVGLGPLIDSPLAAEVQRLKKLSPDATWGSDPFWGDALITAQGVRMLSGQQPLGPNKRAWRRLDPTDSYVDIWNRGQSYVHVTWDPFEPSIRMSNPNPDIVGLTISPCNPLLKRWNLRYILTEQLPGPCMTQLFTGQWMGRPVAIYRIS